MPSWPLAWSRSTSGSLGAYLLSRLSGAGLATRTVRLVEALRSSEGLEDRPEPIAPGAVRRGQPDAVVAEAVVDEVVEGHGPVDPGQRPAGAGPGR